MHSIFSPNKTVIGRNRQTDRDTDRQTDRQTISQRDEAAERYKQSATECVRPPVDKSWHLPECRAVTCHPAAFQTLTHTHIHKLP